MDRIPMDIDEYLRRSHRRGCFICAIVAGEPGYEQEEVFLDDGEHIAFLNRYPTVPGYVLVAPRRHVEHTVRELSLDEYLRLQAVVHRVARAVEAVVPSERMYLLSLGSQQRNAHVHWHIAPLPPGTPFAQQQFHALMAEHGVIPWSREQATQLAARLRAALHEIARTP
jgi:diadenosine tetraphosphate (Ap4A) HIT family hydrolase